MQRRADLSQSRLRTAVLALSWEVNEEGVKGVCAEEDTLPSVLRRAGGRLLAVRLVGSFVGRSFSNLD